MAEQVKFFFQKDGEDKIDLENYEAFDGIRYSKSEGLLTKGKRKDIYEETYADSDGIRVWQGDKVTREATTIVFTFYFFGDNRIQSYQNFYDYVKNGKMYYYDTKRLKQAYMVLKEAVTPSEEVYKGSHPYIKGEFKFQNLWGECKDVTL